MTPIPSRIADRLINGVKRFQPILANAKARDINESDTVVIITDMLSYIFGYDKYSEITSEFAIRGTYCDLATRVDGKVLFLIEVKSIGVELKDTHTKQAIDYAANLGVDWVILTNGNIWKVYKLKFTKPIEQELIIELDFLQINVKEPDHLEMLWLLSREGWLKSLLDAYHEQKQALSRFSIGALILSDSIIDAIRKELKRLSPDIKIEKDQIRNVLSKEIIKRDVLEGEKAIEATKNINRAMNKLNKAKERQKAETRPYPKAETADSSTMEEYEETIDKKEN